MKHTNGPSTGLANYAMARKAMQLQASPGTGKRGSLGSLTKTDKHMKEQIKKLNAELTEFVELSKTITPGEWQHGGSLTPKNSLDIVYRAPCDPSSAKGFIVGKSKQDICDAAFIARSRNISPAMAECLLVAVEGLEQGIAHGADFTDGLATITLQQIINLW
jgi:hypothetical protein